MSYGGVQALSDFELDLRPGEVHAVCGENGAGKSTLNRILGGICRPDSGSVTIFGEPLTLGSVESSESAGIAMVHQESAAFLHLSAIENHEILHEPTRLGGLWLDRRAMTRNTVASLAAVGEKFSPQVALSDRSVAQRQMVAIARAVSGHCKLLVLDEPTASLSSRESDALFEVIRRLRADGVCVLYVSHRLEEVFALADRVTVLRDGRLVGTKDIGETSSEDLIHMMVGRALATHDPVPSELGAAVLQVKNLRQGRTIRDVSLDVHAGEVVVLAGLVGAGRSEIARAIFGLDPSESGSVTVNGNEVGYSPGHSITEGLALLPEDRQHEGLHLALSIRENIALARKASAVINRAEEEQLADSFVKSLGIKTQSDLDAASSLSGGNQQKVLLAKWLATKPKVVILDEPTRGVDVGSKAEIHRLVFELAQSGVAVLVISSDLPEVIALANRVLVVRQGTIAEELTGDKISQEAILRAALPVEDGPTPQQISHRRLLSPEWMVGALLLVTILATGFANPSFLAMDNLRDLLIKVSPAVIVGSMMTLVVLAREIDISVGSMMGLSAAVLGIACSTDRMALPVPVGVLFCLGVGTLGGFLNGLLVAIGRVPSIIVTLGMLTVARGVTEKTLGGKWIENMPSGLRSFGTGNLGGVPNCVLAALGMALLAIWIARRTRLGLQVYALGSNPQAAALRGVPIRRVQLAVFALVGFSVGVAALFSATQLQVIESGFGSGFELVAVASVIVGGTSIRGGRGSVWGTVLGASLMGIIGTVLIYLRLGESSIYWERAIQGGFILLAVLGDAWRRRR